MKNRLGSGKRNCSSNLQKKTAPCNTNFSVPDRFLFAFSEADSIGHFLKPVPFPTKRTVDNGPWFLYRFKKFQTFQHDSLLLGLAERLAQRMTIGISQMIGSRRFDRSADFPTDTKTDRWKSPGFRFHAGPDRPSGCRGLRKEQGGQYPPASAEFFLRR